MTIYYEFNKVNKVGFVKSMSELSDISNPYDITKDAVSIDDVLHNIQKIVLPDDVCIPVIIDATSCVFADIVFNVDTTKVKVNSETLKQDVMSGASLGSSVMLDAIAADKFAILPGRKSANLQSNVGQNHDVIDALATNGLMGSPKIMSEYSAGKVLMELSKLIDRYPTTKLDIWIVHPALKVNKLEGVGVNIYNTPRYAVGEGEILSVFFRYIALIFFPYMSIYAEDDIDHKYDIWEWNEQYDIQVCT